MKKLILIACLFSFNFAFAQVDNIPRFDGDAIKVQKLNKLITVNPKLDTFFVRPIGVEPQASFSHILPNGNKVYLLPQDNMPCIVPDMNQYQIMPNKKVNQLNNFELKNRAGKIPNPGTRVLPLIPRSKQ